MSYILDALKKSESERGRTGGPALYEMQVAPPRQRLPAWSIVLTGLLTVNLAGVGWLALHRSNAASTATAPTTTLPAPQAGAGATYSAQLPRPAGQYPSQAVPSQGPAPGAQAPAASAASAASPSSASPAGTESAADPSSGGSTQSDADDSGRDDDDAPAVEPRSGADAARQGAAVATASGAPAAATLPTAGGAPTLSALPTYQQLAASGRLPDLKLDLHAYAAAAAERFVMINMTRLQEGDSLPTGVRVDAITPDGAVLSYQGQQFLLPRQ